MRGRLITPAFALVTASALSYFIGLGALIPVLPLYVEGDLDGSAFAVGVAVGAFAVTAAVLRPLVGRIGDRRGRRPLIVGGALIVGASVLLYGVVESLAWLIVMRLLSGVGEAAVFVGAATAAQDLAPRERRGEAASYFSIAIYGGLAIGPVLGETVRHAAGPSEVWLVSAVFCLLAAVLAIGIPSGLGGAEAGAPDGSLEHTAGGSFWRRYLHPAAIRPGFVLALATTGFAAFAAFLPLYVDQVGLATSGTVFAVYSVLVLAVRILGGRLPDRLGPIRASTIALVLQAVGFVVLAAVPSVAGLYAGTVVYALGVALHFPSLMRLVVDAAPERERSHAVATFTLFFDVAQGVGAAVLGVLVALSGERAAFAASAVLAVVAVVILRRNVAPGVGPITEDEAELVDETVPDPLFD
ncbi:MAG: MFS transporter [Acidimicrobiales bacterium]